VLVAAAVVAARLGRPPAGSVEVFLVRYDATGRTGTLVPMRRPAASGGAGAPLEAALRDLLAGPTAEERRRGIVSEIPPGTALRGVSVRRGVATVDLTSAFASGGGSTSMQARVWQVVYTGTQFPAASEVQILLDGRRVESLGGEGVLIGEPLRRPATPPTF
jgi:spore germination protein GerM